MNKKVVASIIGVVVLAGIIGVLIMKKPASAPSNPSDMSNMPANMDMSQQNTQAEATDKVTIKDFAFAPGTITVKKGTKVTWTNQDSVQHNVMSDKTDVSGPSSELLSKGDSYSYTFDEVGTFTYHCTPHPYMKATVIVTE